MIRPTATAASIRPDSAPAHRPSVPSIAFWFHTELLRRSAGRHRADAHREHVSYSSYFCGLHSRLAKTSDNMGPRSTSESRSAARRNIMSLALSMERAKLTWLQGVALLASRPSALVVIRETDRSHQACLPRAVRAIVASSTRVARSAVQSAHDLDILCPSRGVSVALEQTQGDFLADASRRSTPVTNGFWQPAAQGLCATPARLAPMTLESPGLVRAWDRDAGATF